MNKFTVALLSLTSFVLSASAAFAVGPRPIETPEPGTFVLLGIGAAGFAAYKKFKK